MVRTTATSMRWAGPAHTLRTLLPEWPWWAAAAHQCKHTNGQKMDIRIRHVEPRDVADVKAILTDTSVMLGTMRLPFATDTSVENRIAPADGLYKLVGATFSSWSSPSRKRIQRPPATQQSIWMSLFLLNSALKEASYRWSLCLRRRYRRHCHALIHQACKLACRYAQLQLQHVP